MQQVVKPHLGYPKKMVQRELFGKEPAVCSLSLVAIKTRINWVYKLNNEAGFQFYLFSRSRALLEKPSPTSWSSNLRLIEYV